MYDVRWFKPILYAVLLLGMAGFAVAGESYGLFAFAMSATLLNAWLVGTGRFAPLPRWVVNLVTLAVLVFVTRRFLSAPDNPIRLIGQFLLLLQLVKLYEQRVNRDYFQLLILSLLLIVAAATGMTTLLFGMICAVYFPLLLYCALLFQLKVAADEARDALHLPEERFNPETLRQDQRYLPKSMRRLTWITSGAGLLVAVVVFVLFPRSGNPSSLVSRSTAERALTGFNEQVNFQQVAQITQNEDVVAHVELWRGDQPVRGTQTLLLRGSVLTRYADDQNSARVWSRQRRWFNYGRADAGETFRLRPARTDEHWRQVVQIMRPTGTEVLFAMPGAFLLTPEQRISIHIDRRDAMLMSRDARSRQLKYEVVSDGQLPAVRSDMLRRPPATDPLIGQYARRIEGVAELARRRGVEAGPGSADAQIASLIESHLKREFSYTLDLTDVRNMGGRDPLVSFLYDFKRGHCEYFAGAMTLLCQSLGVNARMVIGFKSDEYNQLGGYYVVRQSHAHAWVEVLTTEGWQSFDPTTGNSAGMTDRSDVGVPGQARHVLNYVEHLWATHVLGFDAESHRSLSEWLSTKLTRVSVAAADAVGDLRQWWKRGGSFAVRSRLLAAGVAVAALVALAALSFFAVERWRLWRRARRIGLDALPNSRRVRLSRQLGFYDELLRLLERHGLSRADHETPLEFCDSLSFLPAEIYDRIRRLTLLFYKIRFGDRSLQPGYQRMLGTTVGGIGSALDGEAESR